MTESRHNRLQNVAAFLIIAAFYAIMQLLGITCPIKFITGISCPGCGMTRAWLAVLLHRDLSAAMAYHPLFWMLPPAVILYVLRKKLPGRLRSVLLFLACGLMVLVYLWRMLLTDSNVVVFQPRNGLIGKVICWLIARITQ